MEKLPEFAPDEYLTRLMEGRIPCTVIMTNGFQMHNVIFTAVLDSAVILRLPGVQEQMVYKHAISTISPPSGPRSRCTAGGQQVTAVLVLRIEVNAPEYAVIAVKEQLAMELERFGDVRIVSVDAVQAIQSQQLSMWAAARL